MRKSHMYTLEVSFMNRYPEDPSGSVTQRRVPDTFYPPRYQATGSAETTIYLPLTNIGEEENNGKTGADRTSRAGIGSRVFVSACRMQAGHYCYATARMFGMLMRGPHRCRVQALAVGILLLGLYMLLSGTSKGSRAKLAELEDVDIKVMERELEAEKAVQIVTYQPPGEDKEAWAAIPKSHGDHSEDELARTIKFHRVWTWADKVTDSHELFPDTEGVEEVVRSLATARIVYADVFDMTEYESGTSEKWAIILEGGQKAMMKLVWEEKGKMKEHALCNLGYEMPVSEIAGFHLHRIMGFRNTPHAAGRRVDLRREILPVASPGVMQQISVNSANKTCVTGKCFHCTETKTICPPDGVVEASIVYWVPRKLKLYTYPPKYMPFSTPNIKEWESVPLNNKTYCNKVRKKHPYDVDRYYHDLIDFAIIDTLMYHYDSKHYIIHDSNAHGLTVRLDHGRAFCAFDRDNDHVFLAPLRQCCVLRRETMWRIKSLRDGRLTSRLREEFSKDVLAPLLVEQWYAALERRLKIINHAIDQCSEANGGLENILVG